jgi:hypothetical protein
MGEKGEEMMFDPKTVNMPIEDLADLMISHYERCMEINDKKVLAQAVICNLECIKEVAVLRKQKFIDMLKKAKEFMDTPYYLINTDEATQWEKEYEEIIALEATK